ncbi:ankyrin repeat domain-containing protein SOWAHB-like [Myxocyprinus asiaticus]|uniref:ankyrin repeat domain-containing protein SOWAHB-like n=1 Tax=Myxocyprinus asiaticus TaxID=70543 RepID=UPI002223706F|nr:ankyrin repeat domain-containing protein SOWAHB-like [Myxocyprinus asiaticus]
MWDISEASLLDYIYSSGGKVKNSDLSKTYKHFINHSDLHLRAKYREEFKLIIDKIAVVKSENGEKYLVLKKKYRQLMQEQESGHGKEGESSKNVHQTPQNELQVSNPVQDPHPTDVATKQKPAQVAWCTGPILTVTEAPEPTHAHDVEDSTPLLLTAVEKLEALTEELSESDREDDLDKDSGSKSESEHDEESGGSLGPTAVALDPIEKEWIFSAASGKLSHLTQLLKQDSSLANKKDFTSFTALHWAAKQGKADMTTVLADAGADINTKAGYTPLHIAALHGHRHIVDLLVNTYGAKENLRDYSGHFAYHYLNIQETQSNNQDNELSEASKCHSLVQASERRNRKITSLFHSMKKWGSAEELAPVPEERTVAHQLMLPAFRPRKFSR